MRHLSFQRSVGLLIALGLAACGDGKTMSGSDGGSTGAGATDTSASDTATSEASASGSSSAASEPTTGGVAADPAKYGQACAPDDGSAVEFSIGIAARECTADFPEDAPIFRITLYQGVALPVGEHKLDGGLGFAYLDDGNGMPVTGDSGSLTITAEVADGYLGAYNVTLSDSTVLSGSFEAIYCPQDVVCG
ncbi:hypothetical protein [Nannocystis sp.]|uniref:hypothetical protein n=1 Tax=Nannocystis sp. TaxID=1962667 RepID=UPI002427A10F|nr:hypothetical protein [Nannocystis sp.]MBK7827422.1 hypothetical protein [Nannocystis sp.]MBK9756306.1 hypothetical protein [Nannocystis sp.]